jgi:dimethylaniline monooxygenase (N-oxide forming)
MSRASSTSSSPGKRVIIIGAGIYGLCAAKTYLQINPNVDLTIVDADSSVGGVWSASRVYAGLVADLPSPVYEFSDLRMSEEFGIPMWADIPGKLFHQYLEKYAAKFNLLERCQLNTYVLNAEREGMGERDGRGTVHKL